MNKKLKENLNIIFDYLIDMEQTHFEENPSKDHIYILVLKTREMLKNEQ